MDNREYHDALCSGLLVKLTEVPSTCRFRAPFLRDILGGKHLKLEEVFPLEKEVAVTSHLANDVLMNSLFEQVDHPDDLKDNLMRRVFAQRMVQITEMASLMRRDLMLGARWRDDNLRHKWQNRLRLLDLCTFAAHLGRERVLIDGLQNALRQYWSSPPPIAMLLVEPAAIASCRDLLMWCLRETRPLVCKDFVSWARPLANTELGRELAAFNN